MQGFEDFHPSSFSQGGSFPSSGMQYLDGLRNIGAESGSSRIFLMGTKRSGKSSIEKVVFHKMSPHETLFLESTADVRVREVRNNPLVDLQILDFPGGFDFSEEDDIDPEKVFQYCGALVFVIDSQDEPHLEAIEYIVKIAEMAYRINPKIFFEIVIHKVDGDSTVANERKVSEYMQRAIHESLMDHLRLAKIDIPMSFHMTSIYDHSIFEAFSKIVQKLIPQLPFLENLLDVLTTRCSIEKAFLFDVLSKIYVATDSNPFDMQTYELCSDVVDVVIDVSCIYGVEDQNPDSIAFDSMSSAVIRQNNGYVLYLREVSKYLALVCMMREQSFSKEGLVEHNVSCFKDALLELFKMKDALGIQKRSSIFSLPKKS